MENLKEIKRRINSVVKTRQVTHAMKMVSASKLKKAQNNIIQFRPYAEKLQAILLSANLSNIDIMDNVYFTPKPIQNILLILVTSNKGLCGAFNSNIIKMFYKRIAKNYTKKNIHLLTIGNKGHKILTKKFTVFRNEDEILEKLTIQGVENITKKITLSYIEEKYDKVEVVYNHFKNAANQVVTIKPFLPIQFEKEDKLLQFEYMFEPNIEHIIKSLIPYLLKTSMYKILLESIASEHAARMTAMHKATDNAGEMIRELKLNYNKARQAAITKEILEIISGANALSG